ncbi:putative short-chain dehydrogenase/reductase [Auricularia subglabra TFB-10046 SS5]|nr:putative short-chain dehydrogenase/reductase [Auricularia subglabra TFB-10046 SS5]
MSDSLKGRLVFITGASGGIGRATALTLAARGCSLALHYNSNTDAALALSEELRHKYSSSSNPEFQAVLFKADLSSYEGARDLHARVVSTLGNPDILFNNAGSTLGISGVSKIDEIDTETFEKTWRVNCGTAFELTKLCLPHMETQGWGRVIFCSSVAALTGGVVGPHYASSKSALHGLMHWISQKYSASGITSNCIAPALIMNTGMFPGDPSDLKKRIPVGRLGMPEEIAATVELMAANGYMTNKVITVDGGWLARD